MSRISGLFSELRKQGRAALIPFVTAGDPGPEVTVPLLHAMVEAGADIIELGVPFSDPMADGPVIQRAGQRALKAGITLHKTIELVRRFRVEDDTTPLVLRSWLKELGAKPQDPVFQAAAAVPSVGMPSSAA